MDSGRTFPAGSRRARVALLVAGAVLLAVAVGVRAALGAAGGTPALSECLRAGSDCRVG